MTDGGKMKAEVSGIHDKRTQQTDRRWLLPLLFKGEPGFEDHVSEPANAQLDAASWDGRGGCEADGVVA